MKTDWGPPLSVTIAGDQDRVEGELEPRDPLRADIPPVGQRQYEARPATPPRTVSVNGPKAYGNASVNRSSAPTARTMAAVSSRARFSPRRDDRSTCDLGNQRSRYLTSVTSLKIGRYMATTRPPTTTPRNTIMIGSSSEVRVLTAVSTSSS